MNYDLTSFEKGLEQLSITLSGEQKQQFLTYYEYLVEKNKVMNLTAITEYEEVITKHFLDSLAVVKTSCFKPEKLARKRLIDIGTGAGFPGIPLKIAFPELEILLLDSLNKRINFLNEVTEMLGLTKINTVHGRAEDYAKQKGYRESFDFCVSRAVANLSTLSEYCIPFVKQGGCFISYKSGSVDQELIQAEKAVKILGGQREEVVRFSLADTDMDRSFVVIRKAKPTPKKYPRKAGLPSKEPLGAVILS
ncbi:16S rRNA (guanine(527)-N(7))-methyltransferase RsmG [Blautia ammoniilytica]|uniref:Ribosomal RNA small subunit methyltransferase G n=1 Tax=Blautia ammoniilytica TaxID=2981782 RepID=A0ABT2TVV9_9FIRM|nr:16S rRNA (guanine(527)-N(7))-methyltransferase RsmG [Blautia ammoniilytica]MCU6766335.1 16S rRNA (guanine(527)-N(7))-methyltransferase RsmG [Blautia ammoniilytica]SCI54161.1 Ribosomal RNA small subunit methyltransferase G [uncultured Blautia sp.]